MFWILYFLSLIWAHSVTDTLRYVNECIQIIGLAFCLPLIIKTKEDIDVIINLTLLALFGTVIRLLMLTPWFVWGTERVGEAIDMNSNVLGMRMAIGNLFSLYMLEKIIRSETQKWKFVKFVGYAALMMMLTAVALFSGSRKSIIIIVMGIASYEILISRGSQILYKILIVIGLLGLFLYFVFNNPTMYDIIGSRLENLVMGLSGQGSGGSSFEERSFYIEQAKNLFLKHPLLGYGGNNFMTYMREINYSHIAYCHNNFYEMLSTLGIVGFILYYSFWGITGKNIALLFLRTRERQILLFATIIIMQIALDYAYVSYT